MRRHERELPGDSSRRRVLRAGAASLAAGAVTGSIPVTSSDPAAAAAGTHSAPQRPSAAPDGRFTNKVVLITGATSGIGEAAARAMAEEGARIFFCGRRAHLGRRIESRIRSAGGDATYVRADVRQESEVREFVAACVKRHGRIDVAFNNAGIESPRAVRLHEQSLQDMEDVWRTNVGGVFLGMKYEIPQMLSQKGGVIVNTASISAEVGFATIAPYNASKHGVASLTKVAALEYAGNGIRVSAFAPGAVDTPMLRRAAEAFGVTYEQIAQNYPIKRIVRAEEMARVMMWLGSAEAAPVIGTDVDVSGGYLTG